MSKSEVFEAVIGLEIHAQLKTKSKIFSGASTDFGAGDNENTDVVSAGFPGALPVLNRQAVNLAIKAGLALGCKIQRTSVFARKNYFYPDLPKGYQISQYDRPICLHGEITIPSESSPEKTRTIRIERAHLEEDAGKSTHSGDSSLMNYNRSGVPLLEIVSAPDLRTPEEAAAYARTVRQILRYVDACDGNLEEGSLRCDCNVSVRRRGQQELGTKVEIKNVNSFRFVEKAIEYEIQRQIDEVERGQKIIQETRLWDADRNRTFSMRTKEDAQDYRYFPDPDLLPLKLNEDEIQKIAATLPELPSAKKARFTQTLGLSEYDAELLTEERNLADYFERVKEVSQNPKLAANWILNELLRELKLSHKEIKESPISPDELGSLVRLIAENKISGKIGKVVFQEMWSTKKSADQIIKEKSLTQIEDPSVVEKAAQEVMDQNPQLVLDFKNGKTKVVGFFVGAVMKATRGQASPELVNRILKEKLEKS